MRAVKASKKVNDRRATGWGMTLRPHMKRMRCFRGTLAALLAGGVLQACAVQDNPLTVFADPGKYQYNTCEQIAGQKKHWTGREQELRQLMDKADQSAGGAVVNVLAYKADHIAALEELKVLEATARSKQCETPDKWRSNTVVR
jgi:hypothetical protein